MKYWLDLFTPYTWTRFIDHHGAHVSGFHPRQRKAAFERVEQGDLFLCYLTKLSRWCGALEVTNQIFDDDSFIFSEHDEDSFSIRFKVAPRVLLPFEQAIPIEEESLWDQLSFARSLKAGPMGWGATSLRQSLIEIPKSDGSLIFDTLQRQATEKRMYPLDSSDLRRIRNPTIVRTATGEVEVEVPERQYELEVCTEFEPRVSTKMQAKVGLLGAVLGFNVWVPPSDKSRVLKEVPSEHQDKFISALPLNYDNATLKTIENIDVIWLQRRSIAHAFEVEHTTTIYSGLLRMADLLAMQPRMNIALHIVAPGERREQVRREIVRPVFSVLDGGAMADRCSFVPYSAIDDILGQPKLAHMRETIIEEYEEYFA